MRLSEAIRMNGMMKPQGFGGMSFYSDEAPCALGGALQSIGKQTHDVVDYPRLRVFWPVMDNHADCPACAFDVYSVCDVLGAIYHLNDYHRWTRSQIADWVASLEPSEPDQEQTCEVVGTARLKVGTLNT